MSNRIEQALATPVSPEIADYVWAEHKKQVERNKTSIPLVVPGVIRWSVELGKFEFIPEDSVAGDSIMDKMRKAETYLGLKGTLHF